MKGVLSIKYYRGTPLGAIFLFSVYHIINIDNSDKSNPSNARTSSITQASKTPKGINKGLFIIESLLPLEVIKKMEKTSLIGVT